jgi:hypothetical protein
MKRHWVFALAALVALPCAARAQSDQGWGPVFRITPFIGVSPDFSQEGFAAVLTAGGISSHRYRLEHGSSVLFGVNGEYRVWNRFAIVAGGAWSSRGQGRLLDFEDELLYDNRNGLEGSSLWMAKAGLAVRLREVRPDMQLRRLNASIFAAPAFIHDVAKTSAFTPPNGDDTVNHWGLNLGAEAELPLANERMAFQLGFEDWITLWNEDDYSPRIGSYIQLPNPGAAVAIDADNSHIVVFRAGLSWRF